ncbi:MAG: hypothetical protein FJ029_06985 [Actinobacteria bacterium]|nr:hypothetical protein [Actinomycetota bacterium]
MTGRLRFLGAVGLFALLTLAMAGPAGLLAQTTAGFGSIGVVSTSFLEVPNHATLRHNVAKFSVVVSGQTLTADFAGYFAATGGLKRWGYPTSEVLVEETGALTQYFQRGALDFHKRSDLGGAYVLERRLAWDYFGGGLGGSGDLGVEAGTTNNNSGESLGPWGHKVSNWSTGGNRVGFLDFFKALGGVDAFGFPKSEARVETNAPGTLQIAGATPGFVRQYFQAAVMEFHPGDQAEPVKLRLLGDDLRNLRFPGNAWLNLTAFKAATPLAAGQAYVPQVVQATPAPPPSPTAAPTGPPTVAPVPTAVPTPAASLPSATAELIVFGTSDGGVAIYDGAAWTKFNVNNSPLSSNLVRSVHVDKAGQLWIGTDAGVVRLGRDGKGAIFTVANTGYGLGSNDIRALAGRKSSESLWLGHGDQGASRFDGTTWARIRTDSSGIPSNAVRDLYFIDEALGRIWLATAAGVGIFDQAANTWTVKNTGNSSIASNDITAIAIDPSGRIWFGTQTLGLTTSVNLSDWTNYRTDAGLGSNEIRDILVAKDGTTWVATSGGVSKFGGTSFATSNVVNSGLPSNSVRALAQDAQGRIWAATDGGVGMHDGAKWTAFTTTSGAASNSLTSVTVAPKIGS